MKTVVQCLLLPIKLFDTEVGGGPKIWYCFIKLKHSTIIIGIFVVLYMGELLFNMNGSVVIDTEVVPNSLSVWRGTLELMNTFLLWYKWSFSR